MFFVVPALAPIWDEFLGDTACLIFEKAFLTFLCLFVILIVSECMLIVLLHPFKPAPGKIIN